MTLYKVYNLPVYHPKLEKSLKYNLEENYLAISKDRNYVTIPSKARFVECTIAQGHFCNIKNALYHVTNSDWCLIALYLKRDTARETNCKLSVSPITKPQVMYLKHRIWAVSITKTDEMEISCITKRQVMTLSPPLTTVKLPPAYSGFSFGIKLPPYFNQYSKGIKVVFQTANLHVPEFTLVNFHIWKSFDLQNLSSHQVVNWKKLSPVPEIPINDLKSKIAQFKSIHLSKGNQSWLYVVGEV